MNRLFAALLLPAIAIATTGRANVVLIVSDDQGYADISCYPHPDEVSTPNLDCLATEGVRMTSGYASCPVCAPTRAGLLTGRYQQRFGFCTAVDSRAGLPVPRPRSQNCYETPATPLEYSANGMWATSSRTGHLSEDSIPSTGSLAMGDTITSNFLVPTRSGQSTVTGNRSTIRAI